MNEKYSALFTPWKIGNVEIKNRIVQPSMGGTSLFGWLEPCHFDKEAAYHILNRAQNNVGLVLPGMQCVRDTMGGRWLYQNKKMFKDLAEWLPEFHKTGSKLFVQLSAGMGRSMAINEIMVKMLQNKAFGAVGKPFLNVDYITASASATPNRWYPECKSRPLTVEEIHEMVDAFAKTAKLLQDAGVDGVEIHAVHEGYLLDQFISKQWNHREDEYGGSLENRLRFIREFYLAIREAVDPDFPVSVKFTPQHSLHGGRTLENEGIEISDEMLELIAGRIESNIRELEGSLTRVNAYAKLNHCEINEEVISHALHDIAVVRDPKRITPELIIDCVADYYSLSADMLRGDSRKKEIALARHVAVYLTREMTGLSLPRIGDAFGRDHSTIINSCDKVTKMLDTSSDMKSSIADLKKIITEK